MEKQFVTYELALKLKELGYNEPCLGYYRLMKSWMMEGTHHNPTPHFHGCNWANKDHTFYFMYVSNPFGDRTSTFINIFDESKGGYTNIAVPLWQQVTDWLREEYDLHIEIRPNTSGFRSLVRNKKREILKEASHKTDPEHPEGSYVYDKFEDALEDILFESLKLIPDKE